MAEVRVIMSGLVFVILPASPKENGMVLLPRTTRKRSSDGTDIPAHYARIVFRPNKYVPIPNIPFTWDTGGRATFVLDGEDVRFFPDGSPAESDLKIKNRSGFIQLKEILGSSDLARVKAGCLGPNPGRECLLGGVPMLSGRVLLESGTLRPVELNRDSPILIALEEWWGFRSLRNPDLRSSFLGQVFGAVMLRMDVDSVRNFRLDIGGIKIPLLPERPRNVPPVLLSFPDGTYESETGHDEHSGKGTSWELFNRKATEAGVQDEESSGTQKAEAEGAHDIDGARALSYKKAQDAGGTEYEKDELKQAEEVILIRIDNLPVSEHHATDREVSYVDRHFEIFYDLLEHSIEPLVPHLKVAKANPNGSPPGSRCIPGAS